MLQVIGEPIFHSKSPIIQTTMLDYQIGRAHV